MNTQEQFILGVIAAIILLIFTWGLAMAGKWLVTRRNGASLGRIVSLCIWLCGLTLVLAIVMFNRPKDLPIAIQEFPNSFGSFVPKIFYASISFLVGVMIAKIVRDSVATVNFDKWANLGGDEAVTGNSTISEIISTIVFILLIVPVGIGALNVLDLPSFTGPVKNMLQIILNVFFGAVLIGAGVILARVLKGLIAKAGGEGVAPVLLNWLTIGLLNWLIIGLFVFVGIKQMNIGGEIVNYAFAPIAVGAAVAFVLGVILARVLNGHVSTAGGEGGAPVLLNWLTIGLLVFIAIKQMNIGGEIANYAFGPIAVGAVVAFVLGIGLGSREAVVRKINELIK